MPRWLAFCLRSWHYHYSPEAAAALPRYRCWALIDGVLREYTQASIVPLSGAGVYLGVGLHMRSVFEPAPASLLP